MSRRQQAGLFIYSWTNFTQPQQAYAAGFRWLAVLEHEGPGPPSTPPGQPPDDWRLDMISHGFVLGCYGWCEGDPIPVAEAASDAVSDGYSFYIANVEKPFHDRAFLTRFRQLEPAVPLWLSSEISNPRDWPAWQEHGLEAWLPQCYENVNPNATPAEAMFQATRTDGHGYGIPAQAVKPTIGLYDPRGTASAERYVAELDALNQPGFSVWLGETMRPHECQTLGAGIRDQGIATLDGGPEGVVPPHPDNDGDPVTLIGTQHGITAYTNWLRTQPNVPARGAGYDPANINTWPWPDKIERTLTILSEDHDADEKAD